MASLIEYFNYDIFISYRQKDNKYDGWVSTFVENLKLELEATFKDDVGLYFDLNPVDGLAESNEVLESLKSKLKCIIFIPILSQTYCDPKSFAFENEFKAFVALASQDEIGLKVNLSSGNVSSRVLPVRINDLSYEDIRLVESITGGPVRGIDFIYKAHGINRPLRQQEDSPHENINKTFYRNQINKVAQSIKEIILSVKDQSVYEKLPDRFNEDIIPSYKKRTSLILKSFLILITASVLCYFILLRPNLLNSQELLNNTINHYDFYNNWQNFKGKLHLITLFSIGELSEEIIEIDLKDDFYKSTSIRNDSKDTIIKGIRSGKYFRQVNQNLNPGQDVIEKYRLDSVSINYGKQHHLWHIGGIMFLKNSGMVISRRVKRTKFFGSKSFMLTFKYDSLNNSNDYFKNSIWNVYVNPENYTLLGYKIFSRNEMNIVCEGELNIDRINIPMYKFYYDKGNIQWVDLFFK